MCPAGHDGDNLCGGRVWCLNAQIQHKVQLLKDHVLAPGTPPAVVLAHSIGSYMTLQVSRAELNMGSQPCAHCLRIQAMHMHMHCLQPIHGSWHMLPQASCVSCQVVLVVGGVIRRRCCCYHAGHEAAGGRACSSWPGRHSTADTQSKGACLAPCMCCMPWPTPVLRHSLTCPTFLRNPSPG